MNFRLGVWNNSQVLSFFSQPSAMSFLENNFYYADYSDFWIVLFFYFDFVLFFNSLDDFDKKYEKQLVKVPFLISSQSWTTKAQCSISLNIATMTFYDNFGYVWKIRDRVEFFIFKKSIISNLVFRGQTLGLQHSNYSQRLFSIIWILVIWQIFCLTLGIFTIIN